VEPGTEVLLRCKVRGTPTPEIIWLYNNNKIESKMTKADMSVFYNEREAVLRLGNANRDLEGSYTCKAINAAGAATSTCVLTIKVSISLTFNVHLLGQYFLPKNYKDKT